MNTDPIRDHLDAVCCSRQPTAADLDATVAEAVASAPIGTTVDRDALRQHLEQVTRSVMAAALEGNTGEARRIAAAELAALRATSTTTPDRVDPDVAAAVAAIPRSY